MSEINITDWLILVLVKFMAYRQKLIVVIACKNGAISIFLNVTCQNHWTMALYKIYKDLSESYDFFEIRYWSQIYYHGSTEDMAKKFLPKSQS